MQMLCSVFMFGFGFGWGVFFFSSDSVVVVAALVVLNVGPHEEKASVLPPRTQS